jgi:cholesterol transport system auxiliary component
MKDQLSSHRRAASPAGRLRSLAALAGAAAALTLAGCGSSPTPGFELSAPRVGAGRISGQLAIVEPSAVQPFETERIVVKDAAGSVSLLGGGQWTDRLPRLLQAKLIQAFESASSARAVGRPGDGITADSQLNTEIRAFHLDAGRGDAVVELSAKLVDAKSGRVLRGRVFTARTPVGSANAAEVAPALDRSLSTVVLAMIRWVGSGPQVAPPAADTSLRTGSL